MPLPSAATTLVSDLVRRGALPGAVIGVATSAGVGAIEAFGDARPADRYPLYSITKPLVGLAALRLVESGALALDTPLHDALPGFGRDREDVVTLRHLVSHTSGIPEPALDAPEPLVDALHARGRQFAAGTGWCYSSIAFAGLTALIELADPRPWEEQVAAVLRDAGADGIDFDTARTDHPSRTAPGIELDWDRFAALRHPGAGACGAAEDLLRVAAALLRDDGTLVGREAHALMRSPFTEGVPCADPTVPADIGIEWGFAWNLRTDVPGAIARDAFGHSGWAGTELWIHPELDLAWVLLTNVVGAGTIGVDCTAIDNAMATGLTSRS